MATGANVYPYDAELDVAPTIPPMPAVTDADVGKALAVVAGPALAYQTTTPIVAQAALATTTVTKGIVSETNKPFTVETIGADDQVLGLEYVLFSYGTVTALSATGVVCRAPIPASLVRLSSYKVWVRVATTNSASHFWFVKLYAEDTELDTMSTENDNPDEWITKSVTNIGVLGEGARELRVEVTKMDTPGNIEVLVCVRLQDVMATQA